MITEAELLALLASTESFRVEKTISTDDTVKFREAICSFANDMPGTGLPGYLLIGFDDKKKTFTLPKVSDELLQKLSSYARDGAILPPPAITAYKITLSSGLGEIAVAEVQPSPFPPVRFNQRVCVRTGPRKGYANEAEERILSERRQVALRPFDTQPCLGSQLSDLALDLFTSTYRPQAVAADVIEENHRPLEQQLASLRLFDLARGCPTHAGILLLAKDPLMWLPGAFVQYVRYAGPAQDSEILSERRFTGDLLNLLRELDGFLKGLPIARPVATSLLGEANVIDYPAGALRELMMNAVMHRTYESSGFIRILHFSDRIEISSPGPLFGEATPANFPRQTSYRNPVVAEMLKTLGFVNRFGRGVERAQAALEKNGNAPARFELGDTYFGVTLLAKA
jgi:ATP-dependent DNA helicase RecG